MVISETKLQGAFIIHPQRLEDQRGFFARTWCNREFSQHGIKTDFVQCNISFNKQAGTLRGMHYQAEPHAEAKLIRCTMGRIFDVIVDLREYSPTCTMWVGTELSQDNRCMVYVPEGFAHGFISLDDNSEVFYQMSTHYSPEHSRGVRWDDPALGIEWPVEVKTVSIQDQKYPDLFP